MKRKDTVLPYYLTVRNLRSIPLPAHPSVRRILYYEKKNNFHYFFNPFSVQIFIKVVTNIIYSVVDEYRPVDLILYYPSEDYIYYLENYTMFHLVKEIKLNEHYEQDNRERILVYRLQY